MATIDFDPEDYLDEIDTDDLIEELMKRKDIPDELKNSSYFTSITRYNKRRELLRFLALSPVSSLDDLIEEVTKSYNQL